MYVRIYYDYDNFINIAYLLSICVCGVTPPSGTCIPRFARYWPLAAWGGGTGVWLYQFTPATTVPGDSTNPSLLQSHKICPDSFL